MVMTIYIIISGISFTVFSINESIKQKQSLEREALFLTRFTADYCTAPLLFGIKKETTEVVDKLRSSPSVIYALIYDNKGDLFDAYNPSSINIPDKLDFFTSSDSVTSIYIKVKYLNTKSLLIKLPIKYEKEQYGTVVLSYSLEKARSSLKKSMRTASLIVFIILIIVYFLAFIFQKIISEPIMALASVTEKIKQEANYTIRLKKRNNDEIGILYDRFNSMLEQIDIRDKERDITETMLNDAKNHAVNADKLKSAFLANMSHEIRTPMNSIIGFASLLRENDLEKEVQDEYIDLINSSCNTLLHLIDNILDISKIEAGQIKINMEKCSVPLILQELYLTFKEINLQSNHNSVEFILNLPSSLPKFSIETDTVRLRQILSNLLSNAIKFTHKGKIEIGYTIIERIRNNEREKFVKFFIHDTGIGMNPNTCNLIFERFTKIESNNNKLYRGAGLGLTITKKLIELLNGEIWVDSQPENGSSFYFILPAPNEIRFDDSFYIHPEIKDTVYSKYSFPDKEILVVEDDPSNYELLKAILRKTNASIVWSKSGMEALSYCKSNKPDLILMDIKMPDMNGYEVTSHLRKLKVDVPIIAQTAFARIEDENMILKSGFNGYLSKPINKQKLLAILAKFFDE
jgi:signal transduction histidine kinase